MKPINESIRNLKVMLRDIGKQTVIKTIPVTNITYKPCEYKIGSDLPNTSDFIPFENGMTWGRVRDSHAWFYFTVDVPEECKGKEIKLNINTGLGSCWDAVNPQFIVYVDGHIRQGMDVNHTYIMLGGKDSYDIMVYAYSGMENERKDLLFDAQIIIENEDVKKYYYDLAVPFELIDFIEENTYTYQNILAILEKSTSFLNLLKLPSPEFYESVKVADAYLQKEFYGKFCKDQDIKTICIGHTHIDIAWLWTIDQTREKAQRSFATVIELMKRYPEYKFMSSQAVLYKMVKEECPELYEEIKAMIKAGRWEVEGAMWVEADCNLSSGESLVRQVQYGKNFFRDEFGVESRVLWLPDVFGYSAALPQILSKSDVNWFVTSKIGWNDTNTLPYDTFKWKGLDGTEINTYFITAQQEQKGRIPERTSTYIPHTDFSYVDGAWNRYQQKALHNEALLTFGWGDGGGGPTAHMLENLRRANAGVPQVAQAKMGFATDFLNNLEKSMKKNEQLVPTWQGELYLEFHRGTYTSIAKNKKNNRQCEFLLLDTEALCVMLDKIRGSKFPKEELHAMWEILLVNQFHDIIPGSSIVEVYERSDKDYAEIKAFANKIREEAFDYIASNVKDSGYVVFNPHSFTNSSVVDINGKSVFVKNIPPKGYKVVTDIDAKNTIEIKNNTVFTKFFTVKFDKDYNITSIYDKKNHREVIKKGAKANNLIIFEDYPDSYPAWELQRSSNDKEYPITNVYDVTTVVNGAKTGISYKRKHMDSEICQTVWFYEDMPKIDFETKVDWHEKNQILKASFPVDINADKATYEIQFGTIERPTHYNTSWDHARFEVCAHKYADISEGNYGVSLLNDSKYGHDIHGSDMRLTLLKCAMNPDNNPTHVNDQGTHEFTYSLYPHKNALNGADTVKYAYDLNLPMTAKKANGNGTLPSEYSLVSVSEDNVIIEAIKEAEYSNETVVRLYETKNSRTRATVNFGFDVNEVYIADLNEKKQKKLAVKNSSVSLDIKPFEIVTLIIK
ncbi:MAG: alpha-mannosidase [Ruminococcaceae bacterium]|nr:alpha-mannosidase [Oscillospiraceae bacterium]